MDQPGYIWSQGHASALKQAWGNYRVWAKTSREQKKKAESWRSLVLILIVFGAVAGTLSREFVSWGFDADTRYSLPGIIGIISGISVGLAGYISSQILSPERGKPWLRTRSIAEALKSESYLFCTGVPPYDTPEAASRLLERSKELLDMVKDLQSSILTDEEKLERLPEGYLSVEGYIEKRVDDQINNFYYPSAQKYDRTVSRGRIISFILGALAVILGVFATKWTAGWIALITTLTSSVGAYLYAGRYQYLIVIYQSTARQLEHLKAQFAANPQDISKFVKDCEDVISIENQSWMAKLSVK